MTKLLSYKTHDRAYRMGLLTGALLLGGVWLLYEGHWLVAILAGLAALRVDLRQGRWERQNTDCDRG